MFKPFVKNPNYAEYLRPSPGPGKYKLPSLVGCKNHDPRKPRLPCYTMNGRPLTITLSVGPGPGQLNVANLNRYGRYRVPAYMGRKLQNSQSDVFPGPNAYALPKLMGSDRTKSHMQRSPDFSFGHRLTSSTDSPTPGPAQYYGKNDLKAVQPRAPSYSMAGRPRSTQDVCTPGPGQYVPITVFHRIQPTLRGRNDSKHSNVIPGPNQYDLMYHMPGRKTPAFSMGIRYPDWLLPAMTASDN